MNREEAINVVKLNWPEGRHQLSEALKTLIPEFQESEDEKIRKWIRKELEAKYVVDGIVNSEKADKAFAWLEKLVEQKPIFRIGDYVRNIKTGDKVLIEQLDIATKRYCYVSNDGAAEIHSDFPFSKQDEWEVIGQQVEQNSVEWSEEDETGYVDLMWCIEQAGKSAKDENDMGNIWYAEKWLKERLQSLRPQQKEEREPMEIKYGGKIYQVHGVRVLPGGATGYIIEDEPGHYDCIMNPEEVLGGGYGVKQNGSPYPTKDTAFSEQPAEWSEEDVHNLNRIAEILVESSNVQNWWKKARLIENEEMERLTDFLKSLRPRPKQEWSDEDRDYYDVIIAKLEVTQNDAMLTDQQMSFLKSIPERFNIQPKQGLNEGTQKVLDEISDYLKYRGMEDEADFIRYLRPQPHWKPSEEQMKMLKQVIDRALLTCRQQYPLEELYKDLQKLL